MKRLAGLLSIVFTISLVLVLVVTSPVMAYENHCWNCGEHISSTYCVQCVYCGWYVCVDCGACKPSCEYSFNHPEKEKHLYRKEANNNSSTSSSNSSSSYSSGSSSSSSFPSASSNPSETAGKTPEELGVEYHEYDDPDYEYYHDDYVVTEADKEKWAKEAALEEHPELKDVIEDEDDGSEYDSDDEDGGGNTFFWIIGGLIAAFLVVVGLKSDKDLKDGKK